MYSANELHTGWQSPIGCPVSFDFPQISHQSQGSFVEKEPYFIIFYILPHKARSICKNVSHAAQESLTCCALHDPQKSPDFRKKSPACPEKKLMLLKGALHNLQASHMYLAKEPYILG
mmetsp:Transcript_68253/g.110771  ORF Transcript_68253/g.110771 Transcript_68253/m.110771 type:complete len:118 (+) Transcript_68253:134-487(+)